MIRRRHRARRRRRLRERRHDMFEPTDYDFPDETEVEDWMISQVAEAEKK